MEYEQLESGTKVISKAIASQDIDGIYALLSPDVVLVTHFPYPDHDSGSSLSETTRVLRQRQHHPQRRKQQLLKEQADRLAVQQERYRIQLAKMEGRSTSSAAAPVAAAAAAAAEATTTTAAATSPPCRQRTSMKPRSTCSGAAKASDPATAAGASTFTSSREPIGVRLFLSQPPPAPCSSGEGADAQPHAAAADAQAPHLQQPIGDYGDRVDIAEGRVLVAERFFLLLSWLSRSCDFTADTKVQLEARKGILQDSEVLPPPRAPTTEQERYMLIGRQHTDRNQRLSRLTVTWGSENLLFRDQYYFDDGVIVTVHRRMLTLAEMVTATPYTQQSLTTTQRTERIRQEVQGFYGVKKSRVSNVSKALPLLDFSFLTIDNPTDLLTMTPATGKKHVSRPPRPAVDPRLAQGVFLNQDNDPTKVQSASRQLIKARNKKGEEEAYEFDAENGRFTFMDAVTQKTDASPQTIECELRYDANSVRVATCGLGSGQVDRLVPVLRGLVANALLCMHSLDLSDNRLTTLPDFTLLPLQRLSLHGNLISDWAEVEEKVCPLPHLSFLTLHGNPLAEKGDQYWPMLLSRLLRHPARLVKLRQLDFVTLTSQDYQVAGAFEMFATGNKSVLEASKVRPQGVAQR